MARGLNRVEIIGNLGADPEIRYTQHGTAVANFNVACTEQWTKDGQTESRTEWVRCVAWGKLAEICEKYLAKGKQIYCAGKMQTRKWEDRDGIERHTTEVVLSDMLMLGSRQDRDGHDPNVDAPHTGPHSQDQPGVTDEDIPFAWLLPLFFIGWLL